MSHLFTSSAPIRSAVDLRSATKHIKGLTMDQRLGLESCFEQGCNVCLVTRMVGLTLADRAKELCFCRVRATVMVLCRHPRRPSRNVRLHSVLDDGFGIFRLGIPFAGFVEDARCRSMAVCWVAAGCVGLLGIHYSFTDSITCLDGD